jgi:DNA-directed RNA polymerase specialized sigma subunit
MTENTATINYQFADGHCEDIEVTEEFAKNYAEFAKDEQRRIWRENKRKKREVSLERLMSSGWDVPDPVNRDPQEMYIEQERPVLPHFIGLTEYQRRVAVKYFVEHRTHEQIAREEKVSQQAITKLIHKIQTKIVAAFV